MDQNPEILAALLPAIADRMRLLLGNLHLGASQAIPAE